MLHLTLSWGSDEKKSEQAYLEEGTDKVVVVRLLAPEDIPPAAAVEGMHLGAGQGSPPVGDTHPEGDMHSEAEGITTLRLSWIAPLRLSWIAPLRLSWIAPLRLSGVGSCSFLCSKICFFLG